MKKTTKIKEMLKINRVTIKNPAIKWNKSLKEAQRKK